MDSNFEQIIDDLKEKAASISLDDDKLIELLRNFKEKLEGNEFLSRLASDIRLTMEMVMAWKKGDYPNLSQNTVILVVAGILYIMNPINILPKVLKKTILDDLLLVMYILKKVKEELNKYKEWKMEVGYVQEDDDNRSYIEL